MNVIRESYNYELHQIGGAFRVYDVRSAALSPRVDELDAQFAETIPFDTDFDQWAAGAFH